MITYRIGTLQSPVTVDPGDRFKLSVHGKVVHNEEITALDVISHWAYMEIPGVGAAYFIGNEKLAEFLAERFPDAKMEKGKR